MATLTGQYISQSYGGVVHLSTNTGIVTGSIATTQLQDGFGTNLGLFFSGQGSVSSSFTGSLFGTASSAVLATDAANAFLLDSLDSTVFTLTLVSGSATFLNPTNIKSGQTAMLQITQAASGLGTLSFGTTVTFPSGYNYSATTVTSSVDLISFVSFNTSSLRGIPANQFI